MNGDGVLSLVETTACTNSSFLKLSNGSKKFPIHCSGDTDLFPYLVVLEFHPRQFSSVQCLMLGCLIERTV